MRYFLHISFDGSNYHGWQFQPNVISVQETIENELTRIFKYPITLYGCGRTDAGVHASQYLAHINLRESLNFDLKFRLNKNLPSDISIHDVIEVDNSKHARYDAISRRYNYFIHLKKDPFLTKYSSFYELDSLDYKAMTSAVELLLDIKDFKALCRRPHIYKHTLCNVSFALLTINEQEKRLQFTIQANRFLHGMIRIIVNYILQIGMGTLSLEEFHQIVNGKKQVTVKRLAVPNGLYLSKVEYPYLNISTQNSICKLLKSGLESE